MTIEHGKIVAATLLIVDDDKDIREALASGISIDGLNLGILTAHNAVTGAQLARQNIPDVMIIDYAMPLGNGFDLANEIRQSPELKDTKLLMLTAQNTPEREWDSVEHDIDAFIGKPFDLADIEAHILSLLIKTSEQRT